jgi:predicted nucleotidyltransferase
MRLTPDQVATIKRLSAEQFGQSACARLFGSRLRDDARGGDVDLMVEAVSAIDRPAWQGALLAARVSRAMYGRKVDVVLSAPNLRELPIHAVARREGVVL